MERAKTLIGIASMATAGILADASTADPIACVRGTTPPVDFDVSVSYFGVNARAVVNATERAVEWCLDPPGEDRNEEDENQPSW